MKPEECNPYPMDRLQVFEQIIADAYTAIFFNEGGWPDSQPLPGWMEEDHLTVFAQPELLWAAAQNNLRIPILYSDRKLTQYEVFIEAAIAKPISQYNQIWPQ